MSIRGLSYIKYRTRPVAPFRLIEKYEVATPGGSVPVKIVESLSDNTRMYYAVEPELTEKEEEILAKMFGKLYYEMPPPPKGVNITSYIAAYVSSVLEEERFGEDIDLSKIYYYLVNYTTGLGPLCPMVYDSRIEDINVNGAGRPIVIVHRDYGHLVTNKMFFSDDDLDKFILYLTNKAGTSVSVSRPWVEFNLENKRVSVVFGRELSPIGSGISIRQYTPQPLTILDLVKNGTMSAEIAAYLWEMIDRLGTLYSFLVAGPIGSGKTTMLNALLSLVNPGNRIVTVEEVEELRLHEHTDWKPLVTRGGRGSNITLFDLLKMAMRMRPDIVVVGEIRGEEAYALFQALALGHMIASTVHAGDWLELEKRLTSPPMNIPEGHLVLLRQAIFVNAFEDEEGRITRRVISVVDVDYPDTAEIARWNPAKQVFEHNFRKSLLVKKVSSVTGMSVKEILDEIKLKTNLIKGLIEQGVTEYKRLAIVLRRFYRTRSYDLSTLLEGLT